MNRISGLEKNQAPWHLRWFYTTMRKMFGKDLTPVKQHMRVPGLVWEASRWKPGLPGSDAFRCGSFNLERCGQRLASVARFESTSILPLAERLD